jgi:ATP-dependent Clp protease ATP-binding subunit ClpA
VFERFNDQARRVLALAEEEAGLLHHGYIGTEHLLLGLIEEGEGVAAQALDSFGITLEAARREVEEEVRAASKSQEGSLPLTPRAEKVLDLSLREATQLGEDQIATEHILLGLARLGEGVAVKALNSLGINMNRVRQQALDLMSNLAPEEATEAEETKRRNRLHILEGLIRAIEDYDQVHAAVRGCRDAASASKALMGSPFRFSEIQAQHVLEIRITSLTEDRVKDLYDERARYDERSSRDRRRR